MPVSEMRCFEFPPQWGGGRNHFPTVMMQSGPLGPDEVVSDGSDGDSFGPKEPDYDPWEVMRSRS